MKSLFGLVLLLAWPSLAFAQKSADVTLFCNSLRFPSARTGDESLYLTTDTSLQEITNELSPVADTSLPDHGANFLLDDVTFGNLPGVMYFNTPALPDENKNGFDDFFEVGQAVPASSTEGFFESQVDAGTVSASWRREAGSATGICKIRMVGDDFGELPEFTFSFELISYAGKLTYTTASDGITGSLVLTNAADPSKTLSGPIRLTRAAGVNRFDLLTLQEGTLTNQNKEVLRYGQDTVERDTKLKTNYYSFPSFQDGEPGTSTPDYPSWTLSVDDPNDANGNGIPDLSDDPGGPDVAQPFLTLVRAAHQLLLTITSGGGRTYSLERTSTLGQTNWQTADSITVTNDPQTMVLSTPTNSPTFWRLRAP